MEKKYDFRKTLLQVHKPDIRDFSRNKQENEFYLNPEISISIKKNTCEVVKTAVYDFVDFLKVSMDISASVTVENDNADIKVCLASEADVDLGDYAVYRGFSVDVNKDGICVFGHDARGAAQGLYYIEDVMSMENAPAIAYGTVYKKPMFSPQMVHSGYGLDQFPDEHLARIAHEGRDAILVFTKDVNKTPDGFLDFNLLIHRAAKYGLDVYAYSYLLSEKHPEDPDAEAHYESTYGKLFKECPGLKGVTLVGESVEFPSKDPNISPGRMHRTEVDNIPTGKWTAGWWPCYDYPMWINLVKKIIRKYNPDADIVFWTYNWGRQPKEARVKLLEALPTDITVQATFEMVEQRSYGDTKAHIADYSLSFEGPGQYFESEAEVAARRGIRLYSMTNTGGLTWDFGVIPYEPMPYQWIKRFESMRKAYDDYNLCGIMESHHYGFYPSFISMLGKWSFWEPREDMNVILERILKGYFGRENYEKVDEGLRYISEAITYYTPTDADQYGAFRIGPAYPFNIERDIKIPSDPKAHFGNRIIHHNYFEEADNLDTPVSIRIPYEIESLSKMLECMQKGVEALECTVNRNKDLEDLLNLVRYMTCCVQTGLNAKKWYVLKVKMRSATTREELSDIYDKMEELLKAEMENAKKAIPYVEADSRLGWEPSMLYIGDAWHIEWKLRHSNYILEHEIGKFRKCLEL